MPNLPAPEVPSAGHQTPEDRMASGKLIATFEDLEGLSPEELHSVAVDCMLDADPESCVPCRAFAMLQEETAARRQNPEEEWEQPEGLKEPFVSTPEEKPVAERFAAKVDELSDLVLEMLSGPPIPPRGVELEELAVLTFAARQWVALLDANEAAGMTISPQQALVKSQVVALTERFQR